MVDAYQTPRILRFFASATSANAEPKSNKVDPLSGTATASKNEALLDVENSEEAIPSTVGEPVSVPEPVMLVVSEAKKRVFEDEGGGGSARKTGEFKSAAKKAPSDLMPSCVQEMAVGTPLLPEEIIEFA